MAAVLVLATAALYTTRLSHAPVYLVHDEVNFALQAASVAETGRDLNGRLLPVYFAEPEFPAGRDPLSIYAMALALQVMPLSEAAVRVPTALVGVIHVALVLLVASRLFGRSGVALAAAAILALSPGHFIHSRMALSVMYPVPFVVLWLLAMQRVDTGSGRRAVIAAGVALGLGVYGYLAGLVMAPLYLALTALLLAERGETRRLWWAVLGFVVVLIPVVAWSLVHPERYGDLLHAYRIGEGSGGGIPSAPSLVSVEGWRTRVGEWWIYFDPDYLFLSGDTSPTNSTRLAGLFPTALVVFLPLGLWRLARGTGVERLIALGFISAPLAIVLTGTLSLHRYRGMFVLPFGALVAAYGLTALWSSPKARWRMAGTLLLLTVPLQFWGFYRDYMGAYRTRSSVWYGGNLRGALTEVLQRPPGLGGRYISRAIPYADVYWRFYAQTVPDAGRHLPVLADRSFDAGEAAVGSLAVTSWDDPLAVALDQAGWARVSVAAEPSGAPSFVVFQKTNAVDSVVSLTRSMSDLPFDPPRAQPLHGETVVFTGKLWSFGRKEARALVDDLGGASDDDVTVRTTLLVVGAASYPDGAPDLSVLLDDTSTQSQKLRRVAQVNAEAPGRIRVLSEDEFCRLAGQPAVAERRTQHYGQRDILAMYPALRPDHLRYLEKWGFIKPAFKNNADTFFGFADLTVLRQVAGDLQQGTAFRALLRDMQASRTGQLAFDFRLDARPARIIELKPRPSTLGTPGTPGTLGTHPGTAGTLSTLGTLGLAPESAGALDRELSAAEQYFLMGSLLDDGTPERMEEAAKAYRRALEDDPDLVAAIINLANIRYSRDELAEAQALYERAILLDPTYFEAHFNLGNIHHDHAQYGDAEAAYRAALSLNNGYADAHFYLAVTLEKMGRSLDARPHWRAYERLAPQGEWVELAKEFSD